MTKEQNKFLKDFLLITGALYFDATNGGEVLSPTIREKIGELVEDDGYVMKFMEVIEDTEGDINSLMRAETIKALKRIKKISATTQAM